MATEGSNLSTRMSAEAQNSVKKNAYMLFKKYLVEISNARTKLFPFLKILHDCGFITKEKYKESQENFTEQTSIPDVIYNVLSNLEKTFDLPLLDALISKATMESYPDLNYICKIFKNVTSSEDSVAHRNTKEPPKASTSALKRKPGPMNLRKSSTSGSRPCKRVRNPEASSGSNAKKKRPEAGSSAVRSGADQEGFMDLGNKSALQKPKRRRRARQQPGVSVNFRAEILRVTCGEISGLLIKRKLKQGATRKCIRTEDGNWLTPREFEVRGGYEKASNWKTSLTCGGKTLKQLMELKYIQAPPITREIKKKMVTGGEEFLQQTMGYTGCFYLGENNLQAVLKLLDSLRRQNQEANYKLLQFLIVHPSSEENSDKCKICQDGGKLVRCENCQSFFHGDCHLPLVDTKRNGWNCTFCTTENSSQSLQCYRESEVLEKQMGPERKMKCEFLLLKVYRHLESNIFPNIPRGNYVRKASQYLGKLRKLDIIKKKLIKENYCKVKDFKEAMDKFFQDPRGDKLHLNQEEFMKNFKEVFAIQETN